MLRLFFGFRRDLAAQVAAQLVELRNWFEDNHVFHLYGSSLLLTYDALDPDPRVGCVVIDFSHVRYDGEGPDDGFVTGLENLHEELQKFVNEGSESIEDIEKDFPALPPPPSKSASLPPSPGSGGVGSPAQHRKRPWSTPPDSQVSEAETVADLGSPTGSLGSISEPPPEATPLSPGTAALSRPLPMRAFPADLPSPPSPTDAP